MPAGVLIDTNIFIRSFDPDFPEHDEIKAGLTVRRSVIELIRGFPS